jgi:hypothetical protein
MPQNVMTLEKQKEVSKKIVILCHATLYEFISMYAKSKIPINL